MLASITLVGGGAGDGEARASARCKAGLPLCAVPITTLSAEGSDHKWLEQKSLRVGLELALFPLSLCFSFFLYQDISPKEGES